MIDCCYSGQWVLRLAEYLTSQGIGACGHCSRKSSVLIKVIASCLPHETAYDGAFSKNGVCIDDRDHRMHFLQSTINHRQTPCTLDATEICCFTSSRDECKWPSIPNDTNWSWSQLADSEQRRSIVDRVKVVGTQAWHCVLVKSHLEKKFEDKLASRKIAVADFGLFGHVLCRGWARRPVGGPTTKFSLTLHMEYNFLDDWYTNLLFPFFFIFCFC